MITLKTEKNKRISQEEYDEEIKKLPIHQLRCPFCGHAGTMIKYGRYTRWVKVAGEMVQLRIQRVRCKECGATHAVVLTYIVPYQWERLEEQIEILQHWLRGEDNKEVMERNNLIDENTVEAVIRRYRQHWQARLESAKLSVEMELEELVSGCFAQYGRQFLQIRRVPNQLFSSPT